MERTTYMQQVLTKSYPLVSIEAIQNGFDGSLERTVARQIESDASNDISEAVVILESVGGDSLEAARLVVNSEPKKELHPIFKDILGRFGMK